MPIGACLAKESVAAVFTPGPMPRRSVETPGLSCRALAVCRVLLEGRCLEQAGRMGEYLAKGLADSKIGIAR